MTQDEIEKWIEGYQDIERVIMWHIKEDEPSARWMTVTVEDGHVLAEYTVHRKGQPTYGHYEECYARYKAEDLAAMFDHVRDMEQYWEQDSWPWHDEAMP